LHEERLKDIILDKAYRDIQVREGDRTVCIPMAQAIVRSMAVNAAKGQCRAQRLFSELLATTETSRRPRELRRSRLDPPVRRGHCTKPAHP